MPDQDVRGDGAEGVPATAGYGPPRREEHMEPSNHSADDGLVVASSSAPSDARDAARDEHSDTTSTHPRSNRMMRRPTRSAARRHAWRVASESCGATPENRHAPVAKRRGWLTTTPTESMIRRSSFHRRASTTLLFSPRSFKETLRPTARRELRHLARIHVLATRRIPNSRRILRSFSRKTSNFAPRSLVSSAG